MANINDLTNKEDYKELTQSERSFMHGYAYALDVMDIAFSSIELLDNDILPTLNNFLSEIKNEIQVQVTEYMEGYVDSALADLIERHLE